MDPHIFYSTARTKEARKLVEDCRDEGTQMVLGRDCNAYHIVWESTEISGQRTISSAYRHRMFNIETPQPVEITYRFREHLKQGLEECPKKPKVSTYIELKSAGKLMRIVARSE